MRGERVEPALQGAFAAGILTALAALVLFGAFLALHEALERAAAPLLAGGFEPADYSPKRSAVGEPAAFSSSSITLPKGSRP